MEEMAIIYKITNKITKSVYIGQTTTTLKERYQAHLKSVRDGRDLPLYNDIRKYGEENFIVEEIDKCFKRHRLIIEKHYIDYYSKKTNNLCYNTDFKSKEWIEKSIRPGARNGMFGKKGKDALNGIKIYKIDTEGNIIETFNTTGEALKHLGLKGHNGLLKACRENTLYKGYYWKKEKELNR